MRQNENSKIANQKRHDSLLSQDSRDLPDQSFREMFHDTEKLKSFIHEEVSQCF